MMDGTAVAENQTVRDRLRHWAKVQPEKNFLQCGGDWLTYARVYEHVQSLAGNLQRLGVAKGQQIAFLLPNRLEFALLFLAAAELGVLQVPLNPYLKGEFLRHQLADSGASTLVTDGAGIEQIRGLRERFPELQRIVLLDSTGPGQDPQTGGGVQVIPYEPLTVPADPPVETPLAPGDLCSIMYTSGTTGLPKGCMMSNGYYLNISQQLIEAGWIRHDDVLLTAYQLFHTSGQIYGVTNVLNVGASLVLESRFSASRQMARVRETGATVIYGSGAMGLAILAQPRHPDDSANKLRLAMWLPMPADKQVEFESRFATQVSSETYGQTEVLIPSMTRLSDTRRPGTAGRISPHFDVRLIDDEEREVPLGSVGEITVRPRRAFGMFSGYWRNPEATAHAWRNLWHHTGDSARADADGYLTFADRKKDSLRRRGENVSSMELEQAILAHPDVAEVAVHAVKSELSEDDIKACVVPRAGADPLEPKELFEFFRKHLPYFAIPRYLDIRAELPRNHMGRVLKFQLVESGVTSDTWDFDAMDLVIPREERRNT
ncbi:AMP-binding protein [Mycobacterium marseillense]|uniref:AMP-binding protein n=1 Tax=Mycobacterium marseillense TaxID=701042 RepID=UPI0011A1584D|nr:AMP-binding protein [Mycobacterium marseillense]